MYSARHRSLTLFMLLSTLVTVTLLWIAASARAVPITGIADESIAGWSPSAWSAFNATGVKQVRHTVPWNAADGAHPNSLNLAAAWIAAAEARNLEILISFRVDWGEDVPPPSSTAYLDAVYKFRQHFPQIDYYTAWNEPNHKYSMVPKANTNGNPQLAAQYWIAMNAVCHSTNFVNTCEVIGGDFLEPSPANADSFTNYINAYKQRIAEAGSARPPAWAIHPYTAAETNNWGVFTNTFKPLTEGKPIWFTEVGGMVCKNGSGYTGGNLAGSLTIQNDSAANLVNHADSKVVRTYYYALAEDNDGEVFCPALGGAFDSTLLGAGGVARPAYKTVFPHANYPEPPTLPESDVNADGYSDLLTLHSNGTAFTYPGASNLKFGSSASSFAGTMDPALYDGTGHYLIDVEAVNGDSYADLITLTSGGTACVYPGQADSKFGACIESFAGTMKPGLLTSGGHEPVAVADVTGDGLGDLVTFYDPTGVVIVYPGQSNGSFGDGVQSFAGTMDSALFDGGGHYLLDVSDVTGDSHADLVTATTSGVAVVYPGKSNGSFEDGVQSFAGTLDEGLSDASGHEPIAVGDVTGDGHSDFVSFAASLGIVLVYPGQSNGSFGDGVQSFAGTMNSSLFDGSGHELATVIDVNGDGYGDLVTSYSNGSVFVYPGEPTGTFGPSVENFAGTFDSRRFDGVGHEFAMEKPSFRRRGCSPSGCANQSPVGADTLGVFNPTVGHWCLSNRTTSGTATCDLYHAVLGGGTDQPVAGDWNGDGLDSVGVFNPGVGQWCLSNRTTSGDPECDLYESLGGSSDRAVAGDWNGDGIDTLGVFNPTAGAWCLSNRTTSGTGICDLYITLGGSSNRAVAGDWNGDGIDTIGVFAPTVGHWCLSNRTTSGTATCDLYHAVLGGGTDQPVAGDWNGDGLDSVGVFNPGVGQWCLSNRTTSGDPECDLYESLGGSSDRAVAGDWNGA